MKKKNNVIVVAIVVLAVILGFVFFGGAEHIEDINGVEITSLNTITDANIIKQDLGALGVGVSRNNITNMVEVSSKKFSGVYEVLYANLIGKSDFYFNLYDMHINGGNFKMVVVHNDNIVATITPENCDEYLLEDVNGTVSLVIAGECADFSFKISQFDYDNFSHP
ncbi:MAG: hypothetical protein IKW45_08770 [Clostridia bacterium]|nr:hypothetical protein [Clostridia bacterium]